MTFNASKAIKYIWILTILGILIFASLFVLVSFTKMPDTAELENPKFEQASIIYSEEIEELGRWYEKNRDWATFDELSPNVVNSLLASEDHRFFDHSGIDFKGTVRAFVFLGKRGGASTITQQLARLFFTKRNRNPVKRIWQKLKEWAIAIEFEKQYTKEEIIAMYLNKFDFLHQSYGIGAAAQTYFAKDHGKLKIEEAAVLVAMLKNPRLKNPKLYPENALKSRNIVLGQLYKHEYIDKQSYDSLKVLDIDMKDFKRSSHSDGPAPYFVFELRKEVKEILDNDRYTKPGGGKYDLFQDGLKVFTTIDLTMQKHAEAAMRAHMKSLQKKYFKAWKNEDPWSYDADDRQKNIRNNNLKNKIYSSDRYADLRRLYLGDVSKEISTAIEDVRLWDGDIKRMKEEEKNAGHLSRMLKKNQISSDQKTVYEKIMVTDKWTELKEQWNELQKKTREVFAKKTKMTVFAHNYAGEMDTIMTPLDSIKYHQMHMQLGSMSIEPSTGYVKTWVGGIGHKYFQYDHIRSNRQVGSTFKPFLYTTAIMQGRSPCWKITDQKYTIKAGDKKFGLMDDWSPENSSKEFSGQQLSMKDCLKKSLNSASIWLMKEIGSVDAVRNVAVSMGIPEDKIPRYPSIALGTPEISVMDMTAAYGTFANNGVYTEPVFIKKIEDKNGKVIYNANTVQRQALAPSFNYAMVDMLKYASGVVSYQLESDFGGKTGTTDNHVDGWFMGITPDLVTGTWVGGENSWIRFRSLTNGAGSKMARPFFLDFMRRVEADATGLVNTEKTFLVPEELDIELDCAIYEQLNQRSVQEKKSQEEEDEMGEEEGDIENEESEDQ